MTCLPTSDAGRDPARCATLIPEVTGSADDFALLEAWRGGDAAAGDTLVRRHYASVLRFFEVKVSGSADDLTQRTFLACVESRDRFRGEGSFRAYLFGIARMHLLKHIERAERSDRLFDFAGTQEGPTRTSLSTIVARKEEQHLLLRSLLGLPVEFQIALGLFYFEGLRAREIGEVLQIPTSTVTSRLSRARTHLREQIEQQSRPGRIRETLLADVDAWARSLVRDVTEVPIPPAAIPDPNASGSG